MATLVRPAGRSRPFRLPTVIFIMLLGLGAWAVTIGGGVLLLVLFQALSV